MKTNIDLVTSIREEYIKAREAWMKECTEMLFLLKSMNGGTLDGWSNVKLTEEQKNQIHNKLVSVMCILGEFEGIKKLVIKEDLFLV